MESSVNSQNRGMTMRVRVGVRRPSLRKSIAARTSIRRQLVNRAGLRMPRGYGWVRHPRKYVYNKVYRRTTVSSLWLLRKLFR